MSKLKTKQPLPAWSNEPLKFAFSPDAALKRGAIAKPKYWRNVIKTGRRARR